MKAPQRKPERSADPKVVFGQRLREYRQLAKFSQEALADEAGLDRTYVSSIERGKRNVSLENICRLATALKIAPAELLKGIHGEK